MMNRIEKRILAELLVCLLGSVTRNLRRISFSLRGHDELILRFVVARSDDLDKELLADVATEFEAYHGDPISIRCETVVYNASQASQDLACLVFARE